MTPLANYTWEHHRDRCTELLEMAHVVLTDDSMPKKERVLELDRLLKRLAAHEAAMAISAECCPPLGQA